jgi:hypothetical protein
MVKVSPIRGLQSEPMQVTKNLPTRGALTTLKQLRQTQFGRQA